MSAIPPNVIGSALQSGMAQQAQATEKDKADNARAQAARTGPGGAEDILEIEATDADTQVHTDAGGLGGQGRHDAPSEEEPEAEAPQGPDGITVDEEGRPHLDLSA